MSERPSAIKRQGSVFNDLGTGDEPVHVSTVLDEQVGGVYRAETTSGELIMTNPGWEMDEDDSQASVMDYDSIEETDDYSRVTSGIVNDQESTGAQSYCVCIHYKCCRKTPWATFIVFALLCIGLVAFNVEFSKWIMLGQVAGLTFINKLAIYTTWLGVAMVVADLFIVLLKILGSGSIKEIFCDVVNWSCARDGLISACLGAFFSTDRSYTVIIMIVISYLFILLIFPTFLVSMVLYFFTRAVTFMCNGDAGDAYRFFKLLADNVDSEFGGVVVSEICDSSDKMKDIAYNMIYCSVLVLACQIFMMLLMSEEHVLVKHDALQNMTKDAMMDPDEREVDTLILKSNRVTRRKDEYRSLNFKVRLDEEEIRVSAGGPPPEV